jgi:hypothetical protein
MLYWRLHQTGNLVGDSCLEHVFLCPRRSQLMWVAIQENTGKVGLNARL